MKLSVQNIGKHYRNKWLFKNINFELNTGQSIAIKGRNGSGKSTLVQIVYGLVQQNQGSVLINDNPNFEPSNFFSISAPYLELPIEFKLAEIIHFHHQLGQLDIDVKSFLDIAEFTQQQSQQEIKYFSSGMAQRLKTALCLLSNNPIKLLDEPLTNIDSYGEKWYHTLIETKKNNSIIIVAGNAENERVEGMKFIQI